MKNTKVKFTNYWKGGSDFYLIDIHARKNIIMRRKSWVFTIILLGFGMTITKMPEFKLPERFQHLKGMVVIANVSYSNYTKYLKTLGYRLILNRLLPKELWAVPGNQYMGYLVCPEERKTEMLKLLAAIPEVKYSTCNKDITVLIEGLKSVKEQPVS